MISRRTAIIVSDIYNEKFVKSQSSYSSIHGSKRTYSNDRHALYDFLYEHDYDAWFCGKAEKLGRYSNPVKPRDVKEMIMKLHTGETQVSATPDWTWKQRQQLGQRLLEELADDILPGVQGTDTGKELLRSLELDGYTYRDSRLLAPETDVLDVQEETGVLQSLYKSLGLGDEQVVLYHLALSEDHYLAGRWDDSISNSRKFLEGVLREVASVYSTRRKNSPISPSTYTSPVGVRDYLQNEGLLEAKEKQALSSVYGLLSNTGGHPYMAQNEQARLLRHMALTFSQFVMLRLQGNLSQP